MRRLQSFKTPSRLNEKLKFANKSNSVSETSIGNSTKFVPNVSTSDSNEIICNSVQTNISLSNTLIDKKFNLVEKPNDNQKFDLSLVSAIHKDEAICGFGKQNLAHDSLNIYANTTLNSQRNEVRESIPETKLYKTPEKLEGWSLLQLPKYMPENEKNLNELSNISIPTILQDTPSGSIGKLIFRKGGDLVLLLNSVKDRECVSLKIDCISRENSEQFITAFSKINELINLGRCDSLLTATPKM